MKIKLLFYGTKTRLNPPFLGYIYRQIQNRLGFVDEILFLNEGSKELLDKLLDYLKEPSIIIALTYKQTFPTVAKLLATLIDDNLVLKDELLIPSSAELYSKNSFLVKIGKSQVNLIEINEKEELAEILATLPIKQAFFHIFKLDLESIKLLVAPIAEAHSIKYSVSEIAKEWSVLHAKSQKHGEIPKFINALKSLFLGKIVASSNIAAYIIDRLKANNLTITFAESCTGGLLSAFFTKEAGASKVFNGSVVTYSNDFKNVWLDVSNETLKRYGAVSEACVREMCDGALNLTKADYAIAISGIAGPSGGSETKPVGTVFIGVKKKDGKEIIERLNLKGDRNYIQEQAVLNSIRALFEIADELL